jgi:hypothetical protein
MSGATRQGEISRFNDPLSGVDVFITAYSMSSAGLNLHHMCSDMVIVGPPPAIPLMAQICARIHRLGQTKECEVVILVLEDSFDEFLLSRAVTKYVDTMASETPLRHVYGDFGLAFQLILTAIVAAKLSLGFFPHQLHHSTEEETVLAKYFGNSIMPNLEKLLDPKQAKIFHLQAEEAYKLRHSTSARLRRDWEKKKRNGFKSKPPLYFPFLPEDFDALAGERGRFNYNPSAIPKGDLRRYVEELKKDTVSDQDENLGPIAPRRSTENVS